MNDTPTEERIEEMLEVEHELAEQYEEHLSADPETPSEEHPADSRLNEHTARLIEFERETQSHPSGESLRVKLLLHDGTRLGTPIDWPDDPTDETEELVRLCDYLNVPIDRLGELQGKYIPMVQKPRSGRYTIDIPPIQTRGNMALYRLKRFARTRPRVRTGVQWAGLAALQFGWIPALAAIVWIAGTNPDGLPTIVIAIAVPICMTIVTFSLVFGVVAAVEWAKQLKHRIFPKA